MENLPSKIRIKDIARLANVSVGTVDRVLHNRTGVSMESRTKVEKILKQLDYKPNMYASALASNKSYHFVALIPQHKAGAYWDEIKRGIEAGVKAYTDFNVSVKLFYYDQYEYASFNSAFQRLMSSPPDGIILSPTSPTYTKTCTTILEQHEIPYVYIDSYIEETRPLAFFGQHGRQSGSFAAKLLMKFAKNRDEIVIFRQIYEGRMGSNQQENREHGFVNYLNQHHPNCTIHYVDLYAKHTVEDALLLDRFFHKHPTITEGITFNSKVYIIGEYLQERPNIQINVIGYDLLDRNVALLKGGQVDFLLAQQPEIQGFNGVKTLCEQLILKKVVKRMNYMPIDLLAAENIDFYLQASY